MDDKDKLRVNRKDPDLTCDTCDCGGMPMFDYKGEPFTGYVEYYDEDGKLAIEKEYKNSYLEGYVREYRFNGELSTESIVIGATTLNYEEFPYNDPDDDDE
jgi:hypothetical protein